MPRSTATKSSAKTARKTAAKAPARAARARSRKEPDAIDMLKEDHKKVLDMFKQFEKMKEDDDDDARQLLVEAACAELTVHAQLEEELFYPALREALDDQDMLDEAEVEHASAKQLIAELNAMQPGDDLYNAKFTVLGEYVKHHVEEEEKEMFKQVTKAKMDLEQLTEDMMQRRLELREEYGIGETDDIVEDDDAPKSKTRSRRSIH
ncbi:hemerythrin domain-containing protein [Noviherbaspirillum galbum]|uniref:Hemerythrin domain-containing protein n=1 Tax=Noviherbaspirillum galbum TaxID=2709383 RepID=A0A6B3SI61_9BURK|nr:hemerythrin domain-containing protein [Noviherbaspirillum galbum]NEX60373.1 hemerythrin domain-containing protein [Noviherbaspirillum galbum]